MEIIGIHSYLVNAEKSTDNRSEIKGTKVDNAGNLFEMLKRIFDSAPEECKHNIVFLPNQDGEQSNECRNLIVTYIRAKTYDAGKALAERLQSITTLRSGMSLLFLILGKQKREYRLVISRFPADAGVLAEEKSNSLSVSFVEKVFMKNAKAYKSACYVGSSLDGDFWTGNAIDKQINNDLTISNYWIKDFLISDFATTEARGTHNLATAVRNAINNNQNSVAVKEEISSAVKLSRSLNKKLISPIGFASRMGLSAIARKALLAEMKSTLHNEQFKFSVEEFDKLITFKTIELDNGAFLSSLTGDFDDIFTRNPTVKGKTKFITEGIVVNEKIRKRK